MVSISKQQSGLVRVSYGTVNEKSVTLDTLIKCITSEPVLWHPDPSQVSREHGLGDHADDAEAVFFISPLPSSRLVHCCLDSHGVSSYSLAACAPNTTMDSHCFFLVMDCHYLLIRIVWHGPGQPGLAQTPMFSSVALLYRPLWPSSLQT
jgi:hypothetical protein